ncbi:MAG: glycosyltransferase family 4 protein [Synechococcus sp.]
MTASESARIVAVLQGYDLGGSVPSACRLQLEALAPHYPCLLITDAGAAPQEAPCPVLRLRPIQVRWLRRFAHVPQQALFIAAVAWHALRCLRQQPPHLLIFHSHPPTALLSPLLHRVLRCRVLMVMHGDISDRPAGTYDPRLTWWYRIHTPAAYRRTDAVLALSPYMAQLAIKGGAGADQVHLVPNGVDAAEIGLGATPEPLDPGSCNLLFIGRLEHNKGIDLLLEAFCQIAGLLPQLSLTCIGSADARTGLAPLQQSIAAAGLEARVQWLPPQPRQQLGAFYRQAAIVVVPSRSETQSTVVMEAMAAGRAVVASVTGGNPMLVAEGSTGLLFRPGDAADLARCLQQALQSPERLRAMGLAGHERQRQHFSRQASQEALLRCIAELLSCR